MKLYGHSEVGVLKGQQFSIIIQYLVFGSLAHNHKSNLTSEL